MSWQVPIAAIGRWSESAALLEETVPLCKQGFGPEHPIRCAPECPWRPATGIWKSWTSRFRYLMENLCPGQDGVRQGHLKLLAMVNLGTNYSDANQVDKAVHLLEEALHLFRGKTGSREP